MTTNHLFSVAVALLLLLLVVVASSSDVVANQDDVNDYDDTSTAAGGPIVTTKYGQVEGTRRVHNRAFYEEFLGIPFAAPPVGELRWQRPQPVKPWDDVLNATTYGQHCTQLIARLYPMIGFSGESGEDCLYLNVWVPRGVEANQGRKLPVMFFIYGGGFSFGTGEMYPGNGLALQGDVVVVNFNYRVGTIGWLSTADDASPGNYGLWDLEAALVWVQENIAAFAGDPSRVTLFGQSAGGAMISHAVVSPTLRGLFHGAISISGASTSVWGTDNHALRGALVLADVFGCSPVTTTTEIVECLRDIDPHVLDFWGFLGPIFMGDSTPGAAPVVDGQIVPLPPSESYENGYGRHVNFITGSTFHDAAGFVIVNPIALPALGDRLNVAATEEMMMQMMHAMLSGTDNADELIAMIFDQYPDLNTTDVMTRTTTLTQVFTDWFFEAPGNWEAVRHVGTSNEMSATYQYQFHYRQSFLVGYPSWITGSHMDDIYSYLGDPFMKAYRRLYLKADFNDTDVYVSQSMINYFANFAYTGNPNEGPYTVPIEWEKFDASRQNFLHEASTFSMENFDEEKIEKFAFWTDLMNHAVIPPDPIFPPPSGKHATAADTKYFFHDLTNRYVLTEEDIQRGIQQLRHWIKSFLAGNGIETDELDSLVDEMVAEREKIVNNPQRRRVRS